MKITIPDDLAEVITHRAGSNRRRPRNEVLHLIDLGLEAEAALEECQTVPVLAEAERFLAELRRDAPRCRMIPFRQ